MGTLPGRGGLVATPAEDVIRAGGVVAVLARAFDVWWLNARRIVYVVDERAWSHAWGFGNAARPRRERREERFLTEWGPGDNAVHY